MITRLFSFLVLISVASLAAAADGSTWLVAVDLWGNPRYQTLNLQPATLDGRFVGDLDGDPLRGGTAAQAIEFTARKGEATFVFTGTVDGERIAGTAQLPDPNDAGRQVRHAFTARKLPARADSLPQRHEYLPEDFSNEFSPHRAPVLTVWPGDTVATKTIDSGGLDEHGRTRSLYGNPQTGPFFVMTAQPGDTLAVTLVRVRLNRDFADSLDDLVGRIRTPALASRAAGLGKRVRWKLDRASGLATPAAVDAPGLQGFGVPVRPMLGGLALAPGFGAAPLSSGDTGRTGGNMDFNGVVEGNTVYLPVQQPGALLYLGDAHALQGDGETTQWALETSMDVEFRVEVIKGKSIQTPRVESPTELMVLGQAGSLDDALRQATDGIIQWLQKDYGLSLSESAQVLGTSVRYSVANLAGRSVGVAARIAKSDLSSLERR
ncbi:acetamidase/formamidase family protein [Opitutus sp. ER46]|uniref:acetamidase/formamidase family protein n=1 Tax=Opitutus sp. ER46 TaxID=2161864 RepID=UPI000D30ED2A|nr:acetamidase/formamidase family protein [Opitutus sp. ER46]PTX91299.1 acetamidase [Opitutus sp. ER46]